MEKDPTLAAQPLDRKAVLTASGEAGGKAVMVVSEDVILDSVRRMKELGASPVTIQEAESLAERE